MVPNLLVWDWEINKERTIKHLILFLSIILAIGLVARFIPIPLIDPFLAGRFTGLFGNPNGVGVFAFMLIMILNLSKHYYQFLFSKKEVIFIYILALASILTSGSRGALLASLIFMFFRYFGYKFGLIAFLTLAGFIISFEYALELFADAAVSVGLADFLRIDTIESGSGRLIAIDFAWQYIQDNYWLGPGIGYGDYLFKLNYYYLASLGHQGQVHNAYINTWLDVGLVGLIAFVLGWGKVFFMAIKNLKYSWGILAAVFVSTNAEVWIVGSLSPWMITFLCLITLVVYLKPEVKPEKTILSDEEMPEIDPLYPKKKEILVFPQ
ncbi:O-antigen ligase family protein [Peijinzhouia sedimentorum]